MSLTEDVARLLDDRGHGTYDPAGPSTIFCGDLPAEPAAAIAVAPYPGAAGNVKLAIDAPRFQIVARAESYIAAEDAAQALYDDLVGHGGQWLSDGVWLQSINPVQSGPFRMPQEERGRERFAVNLELILHRPTVHRP